MENSVDWRVSFWVGYLRCSICVIILTLHCNGALVPGGVLSLHGLVRTCPQHGSHFSHPRYRHDPFLHTPGIDMTPYFFHFGIEMGGYFGNFDDDIRIFLWVKENRGQSFKTAKFCALCAHSFHNFMPLMPNLFGSVDFLMKTIIT